MADKRRLSRRDFSYYMQVTNAKTKELIGYLSDISTGGFKLETPKKIMPGQDYQMHIELTPDIADKNFMVFIARSKWCQPDYIDPTSFNVGFEIVNMAPHDMQIFQRMFDKYGSEAKSRNRNSGDYFWR